MPVKRCRYAFTIYFRKAIYQVFETLPNGMDLIQLFKRSVMIDVQKN